MKKDINTEQLYELIDWLETECQSPETADLSHSFAENLMIKLAEISYMIAVKSVCDHKEICKYISENGQCKANCEYQYSRKP